MIREVDVLCEGCELFHRNGEQTCSSKCANYRFLATLPPVNSWIPTAERTPDRSGKYLVTRYDRVLGSSIHILSYAEDLYDIDSFDFNEKKGESGWYDYDSEWGYIAFDDVIAWMPLPDPFEPKESEEQYEK